ncbi:hypothetical protein GPJ56_006021 [Histomonas meleagridis]|uniref:uncharacterized protein n=1 Tax=Histomonas meleagridis TaxID=135588 RepID=UPI003559F2E3|nr:hypothetical protein GPJ56_006021 [Histomonas meleagridis]KAH0799428.1 hypothetical protein GO595_007829 [Histomonas meleagridis]
MSRYFVNELNQMPGYKAIYLEWKNVNKTEQVNKEDVLNLKVPDFYSKVVANVQTYGEYSPKSIDIFRKTYFGLSYYYHETNYRWLHRGTDDNAVNLDLLEAYYESLEAKYDPINQPVILGCCIKKSYSPGFLQGGVGYLYSRRAVELMLPMYEHVIHTCKSAEDICHDEFIFKLGITIVNATSFKFLGHPFTKDDLERIDKNDFHDLSPCPKTEYPANLNHCGKFHGPLNEIVFLHHHADGINKIIERAKRIFAVKDETVHYYFPDFLMPKLCKATN